MERYEAILEQLRKAQSRGMETITNRLDFAVQSLEELIKEAKSSVQGALPESANDYLPVDEIEAALDAYRVEADAQRKRSSDLEARIGELEQAADGAQHGVSIDLMRALDEADSQSELLKELLPAISEHAARAVVLVLREGRVTAWSGIGFADGEVLRAWQGDVAESSALTKLLEVSRPVHFNPDEDELFQGWFADDQAPREILLIPVVLRGKLMGTVYVDRLDEHPWSPGTAQVLVAQVCWLIDTLQYRQAATPTLAEAVEIGQAVETIEPAAPSVDEDSGPESEIEAEEPVVESEEPDFDVVAGAEAEEEAPEEPGDADQPDYEDEAPEIDPSATMKIDVSGMGLSETVIEDEVVTESVTVAEVEDEVEVEVEDEIISESFEPETPAEPEFDAVPESEFEPEPSEDSEEAAPQEPVEAEAAPPEVAEVPAEVQMPVTPPEAEEEPVEEPEEEEEEEPESSKPRFLDEPPPVQPVQPPPEEPESEVSEDEAQREEARRFARLLVSEIKLYNEEQVERGRETKDIYQRLREDIDRSREMFEKRIAADVRENQNYFHDELVRVLADGDADLLGM